MPGNTAECQIIMHTSGLKAFRTATKMTGYVKARLMSMDLANVLEEIIEGRYYSSTQLTLLESGLIHWMVMYVLH